VSKQTVKPSSVAARQRRSTSMARCLLCGVLVLAACLVGAARELHAKDAVIKSIVVANSATDLLLYCAVANSFTPEMVEGIRNGIPVTFTFFVTLEQKRALLPDRQVASLAFDHTLSYDSLKEMYRLTFPGENGKSVSTASFAEAKRLMEEVNGFRVAPLRSLVPDGEYTLAVKARLAKKTLPLNFHYIIPFWHLWDFETDWRTAQFRY